MDSKKSYKLVRADPTKTSIALKHSIIDAAEALYARAPAANVVKRAVTTTHFGGELKPYSPRPRPAPPPAGLPRPKRR